MASEGQQFQYEAMLMQERLDPPLICGCCFSAGICCEFHRSIYPDLPSQPSNTQLKPDFDDDEAWTTNDSGSFLDFYLSSSLSSVHGFGQASIDATSASEKGSSSSSEDEKFPHRSKPCCIKSVREQQCQSSLWSWGEVSQNCNESLWVESLPIDEAHNQFISPSVLTSADKTIVDHEAKSKKRRRIQEEPGRMQPHRNTDADIQSRELIRKNLLDPQILLKPQSSKHQRFLHQLLGIYVEFTSPLNPQSSQAFESLAVLLNRTVKDWINKPTHLECLKDRDGVPIPPAARDPNEPYACVCGCGYTSSRLGSLERHLSQNWLASYWQCPLCDKRFDRRDMLSAHLRSKKHLGSGEKVNEERDFRRNGCDDDFTKQCGFCGEVCKGFKVFIRHIGKHFRSTSSEPPKGMRDWRDTWDDDEDSNDDHVKDAGGPGKPNNNNDRHTKGDGSKGGTGDSSWDGGGRSSKDPGNHHDRGSKQGKTRPHHSGTYNSRGSGFVATNFPTTDGSLSLSLSDTTHPTNARRPRERRKAASIDKLPLRPKKSEKQTKRSSVAGSATDAGAPKVAGQIDRPQNFVPAEREEQGLEGFAEVANSLTASLNHFSSDLWVWTPETPGLSTSPLMLDTLGQHLVDADRSESMGTKLKRHMQSIETIGESSINRAGSKLRSQISSTPDGERDSKQCKSSKHGVIDVGSTYYGLTAARPFVESDLLVEDDESWHTDDLERSWSDAAILFPSRDKEKNAGRPPSMFEDTACTMSNKLIPRRTSSDNSSANFKAFRPQDSHSFVFKWTPGSLDPVFAPKFSHLEDSKTCSAVWRPDHQTYLNISYDSTEHTFKINDFGVIRIKTLGPDEVIKCSAPPFKCTGFGTLPVPSNSKRHGEGEYPSNADATRRLSKFRMSRSVLLDTVHAFNDVKYCRVSSSAVLTSVSRLKNHLQRFHSVSDYTCHWGSPKSFRIKCTWINHAEKRPCFVDNSRSQNQIVNDQNLRQWLATYNILFPEPVPPLSLYPADLGHEGSTFVWAAYSPHALPKFVIDGSVEIGGGALQALQAYPLGMGRRTRHGIHGVTLVLGGPGARFEAGSFAQNRRIAWGAPIVSVLALVLLNNRHAESMRGVPPGYLWVTYRAWFRCVGRSGEGVGLLFMITG